MPKWNRVPTLHETNNKMFIIHSYQVRADNNHTPRYKARKYIIIQRWRRTGCGKGRRFRINRVALCDCTGNYNNRWIRWNSWYLLLRNNVLRNLVQRIPFPTRWKIHALSFKKTRREISNTDIEELALLGKLKTIDMNLNGVEISEDM